MIGCDPGSTDFWDPKKSSLQDNLFAVVEKLVQTAACSLRSMDNPWTIYWLDSCLGKYYIRRSLGCVPFLVNTNSFGIKHCSSLNLFKSIPSKIDMYFQDGSSMMFSPYFAYLYISHFSGIFCLCDVLYNNWYNCPKIDAEVHKTPFVALLKLDLSCLDRRRSFIDFEQSVTHLYHPGLREMTWPGSYPHTYLFSKGVVHWIQITIDLCILGGQVAKYCYLPSYSFSSCFLMRFSWNNLHLNIPKQFQVKSQRLIIFNLVLACLSIKFGRNTMVIKSYLLIMFNPFIYFFFWMTHHHLN